MNHQQLLDYINKVIEDIFANIANADDLLDDKKSMQLLKSIADALDQMGIEITQYLPQILNDAYQGGVDEATTALNEAVAGATAIAGANALSDVGDLGAGAVSGALSAAEKGKVILLATKQKPTKIQQRIHLEAVNAILEQSIIDMQAAIRTAKESANETIMDTLEEVKTTLTKGIITGDTRKKVTAQVMKNFREGGLTSFVTKDNKKLPLDFYARTVVATKVRDAHVTGANNRYTEAGVDLVQIYENGDTCPVCAKYRFMVVSLSGETKGFKSKKEVKLPPYHPNCRGTTRPFVTEFKSPKEIQDEKDKWKDWSPEKDTRTPAQRKAYEKEQKIRRKANEEKKQYMRWQALLGADNFKTLGAFRRAKRSNSPKFQELQSLYRSKARESIS